MQNANLATVLPAATQQAPALKALFAAKGFSAQELVLLSGAHSIGVSHATDPKVSNLRPGTALPVASSPGSGARGTRPLRR